MRRSSIVMLLLWLCASLTVRATTEGVNGVWQGKIHINGADYRIVLRIGLPADGNSAATLDSPDSGKLGIPIQSLISDENSFAFELNDPKVSFKGSLSADHAGLVGNWKQNGQDIPVTLARIGQAPEFGHDGSYLFHSHCASCHAPFNAMRAPWPTTVRLMLQPAILTALETGKMQAVGSGMSNEQRIAVANYLGRAQTAQKDAPANPCGTGSQPMSTSPLWNGWGVDLSNSRFQPAELAGLSKAQLSKLKVKWAFGYADATSAGGPPTIIGNRIFVAGGDARIYSLDMRSGCVYWSFLPSAPARTAITVSEDGSTAYFGDMQARAYAVNAATGALVWKIDLDQHPFAMISGAPRLYGGRLYVPVSSAEELGGVNPKYPCCSFRGNVSALDAKTGTVIWRAYTIATPAQPTSTNAAGTEMLGPSGAAVWNSPTIDPDRHALYIGTGDNYSEPASATSDAVIALDLKDGKTLWVKQLTADDRFNIACFSPDKSNCPKNPGGDFDIGAPPILRVLKTGKSLLIVGQKSGVAYGLDPDDKGRIVWESRIGKGGALGGIEFGGAATGARVYFPLSDWTPDPKAGGGMFALDITTGKQVWSTPAPQPACIDKAGCSAAQQAPATAIPGVVFSGSLDGHMRAYDELDGTILWDFDTTHDFPTVNGVESHGGSINYAGPVVARGMLFITSGYSVNAGMPGNVLLAFSEDGK
jgi:polyvinyl alcohol dehydrogenase (cytochrome)